MSVEYQLSRNNRNLLMKEQWNYYYSNSVKLYYNSFPRQYSITTIKNKENIEIENYESFKKMYELYKKTRYTKIYSYIIDCFELDSNLINVPYKNSEPLFNFIKKVNNKVAISIIKNNVVFLKYSDYTDNDFLLFRNLVLEENILPIKIRLKLLAEEPIYRFYITKNLLWLLNNQIASKISEEEKELYIYKFIEKRLFQVSKENIVYHVLEFITQNYKTKKIYGKYVKLLPLLVNYNKDYSNTKISQIKELNVLEFTINIQNISNKYRILDNNDIIVSMTSKKILENIGNIYNFKIEGFETVDNNIKTYRIIYENINFKNEINEIFNLVWDKIKKYNSSESIDKLILESKIEYDNGFFIKNKKEPKGKI